jgi:glucose-1-phosphate adenylyltransferase
MTVERPGALSRTGASRASVTPVPAQQRLSPHWYTGSADAIDQSINLIKDGRPDIVIVFGANHAYRMDPRQMIDQHASNAGAA